MCRYIRTTEPEHALTAQMIFQKADDNGDVYLRNYQGWCVLSPCTSAAHYAERVRGVVRMCRYDVREERFVPDAEAELAHFVDAFGCVCLRLHLCFRGVLALIEAGLVPTRCGKHGAWLPCIVRGNLVFCAATLRCARARRPYERHNEASYHFKMSRYQQQLVDHIKTHPEFIQPESQRNLILSRLEEPLLDLCASRPVTSLQVREIDAGCLQMLVRTCLTSAPKVDAHLLTCRFVLSCSGASRCPRTTRT